MSAATAMPSRPPLASLVAPEPLRNLPGWLCWKAEHDGQRTRKVPFYANGGRRTGQQGRPEDRRQLTTFEVARAAALRRGFDGVGLALLPDWNITALDFDACVADDQVHPTVLAAVAGTYAELSPSGRGVRAFVRGALGNRKDHDEPFGFETFSDAGFVTLTGDVLPVVDMLGLHDTIADAAPEALTLIAQRFGERETTGDTYASPLGLTERQLREALEVLDPSMPHDPWLRIGMALHHETQGEGFHLWDEWSAQGASYPGTQALHARWESFGRGDYRPVTAHYLVSQATQRGAHIDLSASAADDFDVIPSEPPKPNRFKVEALEDFVQRSPPRWIVKGVLPDADLIVLFGESGSGKSFVALDLAGAIARGISWRDRKVRQGRVVYVAAEGAGGFRNRVAAYCQEHQLQPQDVPLAVIADAPNLLLRDDATAVAQAIEAAGGADLIIVDTFAQVTPGANENAAEDMGKALGHCRALKRATGAPVLLVHHSGKDQARGARGWSGLKAAADAELEVVRTAAGRMLRTSKQKDGEDGLQWGFDLRVVSLGFDEDGDEITSCVPVEAAVPTASRLASFGRKLGKWEQHIVAVLSEIAVGQTAGIEVTAVLDLAVEKEPKPDSGRDTRRQHATRALNKLINEPDSPYFAEDDGTLTIG
jgi:hypothetical protein